ncbi:MAG: hypothetical protein QW727_03950 [Candidatus Pacearchaeota archaeon]
MFNKPYIKKSFPNKPQENCEIKVKKTKSGTSIVFKGNCSKEQIEMAKNMYNTNEIEEEE